MNYVTQTTQVKIRYYVPQIDHPSQNQALCHSDHPSQDQVLCHSDHPSQNQVLCHSDHPSQNQELCHSDHPSQNQELCHTDHQSLSDTFLVLKDIIIYIQQHLTLFYISSCWYCKQFTSIIIYVHLVIMIAADKLYPDSCKPKFGHFGELLSLLITSSKCPLGIHLFNFIAHQ